MLSCRSSSCSLDTQSPLLADRWTETLHGEVKERRQVKVKGGNVLYDPKIVPPEWRAWLAKTRQEPPSEEELARWAAIHWQLTPADDNKRRI